MQERLSKEPTDEGNFLGLNMQRGVKWKRRMNEISSFAVFHVNSHAIKSVYEFLNGKYVE